MLNKEDMLLLLFLVIIIHQVLFKEDKSHGLMVMISRSHAFVSYTSEKVLSSM